MVPSRGASPLTPEAVVQVQRPVVGSAPRLSLVTPAYNEAENLPLLYERICRVLDREQIDWEWIVIDDHSRDETFSRILEMGEKDHRVRGIRLARNFGSHTALTCGLHHSSGNCAAIMAADAQDPPEVLPELLARWREGAQVVWAVRAQREGEKATVRGFARFYYFLMRHLVGMKEMPATGADFFLLDRRVVDAFRNFGESNTSVLALITWMGFRQTSISYVKQARAKGKSGWTLAKKVKLVIDSVTSFSYLPIRCFSVAGALMSLAGFLYAAFIVINALLISSPPQGWSALMVVLLVTTGMQMLMMGVLGEYLWRALDESRRRPRYLIENITPDRTSNHSSP